MISSGATVPRRSLVACTLELKPFAILLAEAPKLMLPKLVCSLFQPSMVWVEGKLVNVMVRVKLAGCTALTES